MAKQRKDQDWCDLYEYVKVDILGYAPDMKLPKKLILRLKGLHDGVFCANKNIQPMAEYSYPIILLTFKMCKFDILGAFRTITFSNEEHKFNYMMVIIESKINDVVLKSQAVKKASEKAELIEVNQSENKAEYKKKTKENKNNNLKDLW